MKITSGLIIADPWIGLILDGFRTWEMRSSGTSRRGWFGLIRKGTGTVCGVARLVDTGAPLSPDEMVATFERHRIPEAMIRSGEVAKWNTPWILADVQRLATPVPYRHRNGAVTWVKLDDDVAEAVGRQIRGSSAATPDVRDVQPEPSARLSTTIHRDQPAAPPPNPFLYSGSNGGTLIGEVEITQGNLDNNHIYLRSFFDRFPEDAVGGSNRHQKAVREVVVDWGGGAPVRTDLDGSKRFFRARGWVRSFFEQNGAQAGDYVLVEETGPYSYRVRLRKSAKA